MTEEHLQSEDSGGLHFDCEQCGQPLSRPGAILFSPPDSEQGLVRKHHICADCYSKMFESLSHYKAMNADK